MSGQLRNQINMTYDSAEDRILIRATDQGREYRAWWTRRLALRMSNLFVEQEFPTENSDSHLAPDQRQVLGDMEKQGAIQSADFDTPFEEAAIDFYPLGEEGILIQRIDVKIDGKVVKLVMLPADGEGLTLTLPPSQRYSFEHMLHQVMQAADWHLAATLPVTEPVDIITH
ncbi:hypothetical protein [Aliamphritea hakodatensis]|uniref:hypothetical protein n=1 Tax=Aliamphritea hakodatensis TaxID=2895352 RepID=UPI0022FD63A3|nr:hypothetical protein [Aliamphritea hakodatensis]